MPRVRRSDQSWPDRAGGWVPEAALLRLDRPGPRLTTLVAPPGSGRRTLVREWLARHPERRWAWVEFIEDDESRLPGDRNLAHTAGAVEWLAEPLVAAPAGPSGQALQVEPQPAPVLVLAGVEFLEPEEVSDLIEALPAGLRTVLIGTGDVLAPSDAVRLAGELDELGPAQLWWPADAIADRLDQLLGLQPTQAEVAGLARLTGGWPAAVLLLARAMRQRPGVLAADPAVPDPDLLDFIGREVLAALPGPAREFVLATSVLPDLNPGACAALAPTANPHAMIADLQRRRLVVIDWPRSPEPRYRTTVRAAALRALRRSEAGAEARLLRRAAEHATGRGRHQDALERFVECEDWAAALAALAAGAATGLSGWAPRRVPVALRRIPAAAWAGDPVRRAQVAFAAAMSGDQLLAAEVLQSPVGAAAGEPAWWPAVERTVLALSAGNSGRPQGAYRAAAAALAEIAALTRDGGDRADAVSGGEGDGRTVEVPAGLAPGGSAGLARLANLLAARAALLDGDPALAAGHLAAGRQLDGPQPPAYLTLAELGVEALAAAWAGRLADAQRFAARAQRLAGEAGLREHPLLGPALLARVELLRARGRTGEALGELAEAEPLLRAGELFVTATAGGPVLTAAARLLRAQLLIDAGDPVGATAELAEQAAEGDDELPGALQAARALARGRLQLLADDVTAAGRTLAAVPQTAPVVTVQVLAALARQAPEAAEELIERRPAGDGPDAELRWALALAAVALADGRRPQAAELVEGAVTAAEADGHTRVFIETPPGVQVLVEAALARAEPTPWRIELARQLEQARRSADPTPATITRRERVVLEYLARPLTHAQIASSLFVSENTLKSHCRNLYRKLGVNSQAEALRVARARGWLPRAAAGDRTVDLPAEERAGAAARRGRGDVVLDLDVTPATADGERAR